MSQPSIEIVGPADVDRARVALVIADVVDESAAKVVRAIQRDGIPRVVLVASRFDESGVVGAVAAGVTSFLRRSESTSARLTEVICEADRAGCQLPEGLLKKAAASGATCSGLPRPSPVSIPMSPEVPVVDLRTPPVAAIRDQGTRAPLGTGTLTLCLSAREGEVLRLVADGYDTSEIAEQLSYSESTIKGVLAKIMTRLDARNRCHAVAIVVREGLI